MVFLYFSYPVCVMDSLETQWGVPFFLRNLVSYPLTKSDLVKCLLQTMSQIFSNCCNHLCSFYLCYDSTVLTTIDNLFGLYKHLVGFKQSCFPEILIVVIFGLRSVSTVTVVFSLGFKKSRLL